MRLQLNSNLYSAPYILQYGDLINETNLYDIRVVDNGLNLEYILFFKLRNITRIKTLRKIARLEPNYITSCIVEDLFCLVFKVPSKCKSSVLVTKECGLKFINGQDIVNVETLRNKKAPSTKK